MPNSIKGFGKKTKKTTQTSIERLVSKLAKMLCVIAKILYSVPLDVLQIKISRFSQN